MIRKAILLSTLLFIFAGGLVQAAPPPGFTALFNGHDFTGWRQHGGQAVYKVEDGMVVGVTVPKTPNSFMATEKSYGDFILELDFLVHPEMNSGVQIRSEVFGKPTVVKFTNAQGEAKERKIPAGRVHGYQVEIDPSARAWTGGIYDESRRGWLNNLLENEPARKAFKQNAWNHFRIEAVGDSIKTWLNGVPAADLQDGLTSSGFIALQVHGIGNTDKVGHEVRWRNIYIKDLSQGK